MRNNSTREVFGREPYQQRWTIKKYESGISDLDPKTLDPHPDPECYQNLIDWSLDHAHLPHKLNLMSFCEAQYGLVDRVLQQLVSLLTAGLIVSVHQCSLAWDAMFYSVQA